MMGAFIIGLIMGAIVISVGVGISQDKSGLTGKTGQITVITVDEKTLYNGEKK
jgi:hypothetical protein